jgi:homoserine kinase
MRFTVRAPASSANRGPGFDALGLALDLWNEIEIDDEGAAAVTLASDRAALLDGRENLSLTAMQRLADEHGRTLPPFAMTVRTDVPVARGLGSSAAALVAGLVAANVLLDLRLPNEELFSVAWQMEGHGDNVGAALYGGAVLAAPTLREPIHLLTHAALRLQAVVFVPEATGLTWAARAALPNSIPHADAAFNIGAAGSLVLGLHNGDRRLIAAGMHDRLHEPYRARLFPHLLPLTAAARQAGALGACLSGAGPSILALAADEDAAAVAAAYEEAARVCGAVGETLILRPAACGAHVVEGAGERAGETLAGGSRRP